MPHTSHRKPSSTRAQKNKRTQSTDSQGWTTIHQGLKPSAIAVFPSSPPVFNCTTSPQTTDFDFTDLRARYTQHKSRWDRSTCNERLRTVLRERLELGDIKGLKKCICLGLGSLAEGPLATKALYQLAALESMLDILRTYPIFPILAPECPSALVLFVVRDCTQLKGHANCVTSHYRQVTNPPTSRPTPKILLSQVLMSSS